MAWLFLRRPKKAFAAQAKTPMDRAFLYYLKLSVVSALLWGLATAVQTTQIPAGLTGVLFLTALGAVGVYVISVVLAPVLALWTHLWVYLLGGRKGLDQTMKATFYASTPTLLFSWIPYIIFASILWDVGLSIMGVRTYQKMGTGRAAVAVILPNAIILALIGLFSLLMMELSSASGLDLGTGGGLLFDGR